jgi:glycosyltransferase involved in cell wall biosynthesis
VSERQGISVVVICRNEAVEITPCLERIAAAAAAARVDAEVVLVDGASTDGTAAIAVAWHGRAVPAFDLRVVSCERPGYGRQRNLGVEHARFRWVAFVSADVRVTERWMAELATLADDARDVVLGGFALVPPRGRRGWQPLVNPTLYPTRTDMPLVERFSTVNVMVRRRVLLATRFDEELEACEDKDVALRLAQRPDRREWTQASERPTHLAREGVPRFFAKLAAEARAMGRLRRSHGSAFPDCFGWRAGAFQFAAGVAVALASVVLVPDLVAAAVMAVIAVLVGGWNLPGWRRRGRASAFVWPVHWAGMAVIAVNVVYGWLAAPSMAGAASPVRVRGTRGEGAA